MGHRARVGIAAALGAVALALIAAAAGPCAPSASEVVRETRRGPTEAPTTARPRARAARSAQEVAERAGTDAPPAPVPMRRLDGFVHVAGRSTPVGGASVLVFASDPLAEPGSVLDLATFRALAATTSSTSGDGTFSADVGDGARVLVAADGFALRWSETAPAVGAARVDVPLDPATVLDGVVLDAEGRPLADVVVTCDGVHDGDGGRAALRTDAGGRFAFAVSRDTSDERTLAAETAGFARTERTVIPGEKDVVLVLERAAWIEGRVVDESGATVADFDVHDGRNLGGGRFEIGPVAPGAYRLYVARPGDPGVWGGRGYAVDFVALSPGERRTGYVAVLRATAGGLLRGRVVGPDGRPVAGALLRVTDAATGRFVAGPRVDADGVATVLTARPAGAAYRLAADPPTDLRPQAVDAWVRGRPVPATSVPRDAEDVVPVVVPLAVGTKLRVRLVDAAGAPVDALFHDTAGDGFRARQGVVVAAPGARVELDVQTDGLRRRLRGIAADDAVDGVLTVLLPRGVAVRGRVVHAAEGPRVDASLVAVSVVAPRAEGGDWRAVLTAPVGADGAFSLEGLADGEATVAVTEASGGERLRRTVDLAGRDVDLGDLRLPAYVEVAGTLVDEHGRPVPSAWATIDGPGGRASGRADGQGRFVVLAPDGLRGALRGAADGDLVSVPVEHVVESGAAPLRVVLHREAKVVVRASFANEAGVRVTVRSPDGGPESSAGTGTTGAAAFTADVPPGTWDLRVEYGGRTWTRRVTVGPARAVEVALDE